MQALARILGLCIVVGFAPAVLAVPVEFVVPLDGAQEVPGPGDPDGMGTAFLSIETDTLTIDWDISVSNIDFPLTGIHIHVGPAGVEGPIVLDFNNQLSGSGLMDPVLAAVLASPSNYYVNVHNQPFPAGAIRGQIPEPTTISLMALGLAGLLSRRRALRRGGAVPR
jgi:hypothetical protein